MAKAQDSGDRLLAYLVEKWQGHRKCAVCGKDAWEVSPTMFALHELDTSILPDFIGAGNKSILSLISVICGGCGNTLLFSAVKCGLVERKSASAQPV